MEGCFMFQCVGKDGGGGASFDSFGYLRLLLFWAKMQSGVAYKSIGIAYKRTRALTYNKVDDEKRLI